jgi:hypothetical protein
MITSPAPQPKNYESYSFEQEELICIKNLTVSHITNPSHLHLDRLAVDELAGRDDVLEDHGRFLAPVQDDVVHFAFNLVNQDIKLLFVGFK